MGPTGAGAAGEPGPRLYRERGVSSGTKGSLGGGKMTQEKGGSGRDGREAGRAEKGSASPWPEEAPGHHSGRGRGSPGRGGPRGWQRGAAEVRRGQRHREGERPTGETEAEVTETQRWRQKTEMQQTQRDGVGDMTVQRRRDSVAGRSREKMRRRRNGGRERRRHGRRDGVSTRQREEKPERGDEVRIRQTETAGRTKPKAGQAGRGRDTRTGCRRTDESWRDTEAAGRREAPG